MAIEFIHAKNHAEQAITYIDQRRKGIIKSLKTPYEKLNKELLNGLEWRSNYMLVGNSGSGKTAIADQITNESFFYNPDQSFAVLKLQFEMLGRTSAMRAMSSYVQKDLKTLSSAFEPLDDEDFNKAVDYKNSLDESKGIYIVDIPLNVLSIYKAVDEFYTFVKKPFIIMLDHTMLVEKALEKDEWEVIRNIAKILIKTKKQYPIIWIILNQFNNEFEKDERQKPNSLSAYPIKKDVYGGAPIYFASDGVIAISKPDMYLPLGSFYGPKSNNLVVTSDLLVLHIIKNRVGEPNTLLVFKSDFKNMRILET